MTDYITDKPMYLASEVAANARIAALEAQVAEMQQAAGALEAIEKYASTNMLDNVSIYSCWIVSDQPSPMLPDMSIVPAWEIRIIPHDDDKKEIVYRTEHIAAAIDAALKEVDNA